ncbi:MAG: VOC family protein [Gemmiger sp.]|nr:VOC family protein [Gemmiger sp.]
MKMEIKSLYLCVRDMNRAVQFYQAFFERPPAVRDAIYSVFDIHGFRLGLFAFEKMQEKHRYGNSCLPSIQVETVGQLQQKILGLNLVFPLKKIGANWVCEFEDTEGNHLELTAPVSPTKCSERAKTASRISHS